MVISPKFDQTTKTVQKFSSICKKHYLNKHLSVPCPMENIIIYNNFYIMLNQDLKVKMWKGKGQTFFLSF